MSGPSPLPPGSDRCVALAQPDYVNFAFSLFILTGIIISYLPQHIRIIRRGSSFGLSPYFVLLGLTSGTCQFANILTLPGSRQDMACCHEINGFSCFAGLLGVVQVGTQWTCFAIILFLFLIYFPRATPGIIDLAKDAKEPPSFRTALTVVGICIFHAFVTAVISLCFIFARPALLQSWADFLGIQGTVLASIQYLPQIWTTYKLKRVGSLSITTMCIQTPGSFVWATSLAARFGPSGWSTWGVYVVTGVLQGTLLVMGSWYEIQYRRRERQELENRIENAVQDSQDHRRVASTADERTPLVQSHD